MQIRISSDKERKGIILGYYSEELETEMLKFYDSLREKDQRRYAAIEAKKLFESEVGEGKVALRKYQS